MAKIPVLTLNVYYNMRVHPSSELFSLRETQVWYDGGLHGSHHGVLVQCVMGRCYLLHLSNLYVLNFDWVSKQIISNKLKTLMMILQILSAPMENPASRLYIRQLNLIVIFLIATRHLNVEENYHFASSEHTPWVESECHLQDTGWRDVWTEYEVQSCLQG